MLYDGVKRQIRDTNIMRAFIAIGLPKGIKDSLGRLQQKLKKAGADVKWVEPENIHLTLKFLGEIDEQTKDRISSKIEELCQGTKQFSVALSSCGAFPSNQSPRVIWTGINQGDNEVKRIAGKIEEFLSVIGISKENREFSSHITIGRTRSGKNRRELAELLDSLALKPLEEQFLVSKITLFKSTLTPAGPIYEVIREFFLLKS